MAEMKPLITPERAEELRRQIRVTTDAYSRSLSKLGVAFAQVAKALAAAGSETPHPDSR